MYDVIIIGAGMAGLTAAMFCSRRDLKTLILSIDIGGQLAKIDMIENWPGEEKIVGFKLAQGLYKQAEKYGAKINYEHVTKIKKKSKYFELTTPKNIYSTKTVILAFGKVPRKLGLENEDKFNGKGISYCVNCDGPFFKNKVVSVVGGGNSAIDAALYLSKISKKVYLIHRGDEFKAEPFLVSKAKKLKNIEILTNQEIKEILGQDHVSGVILKDGIKINLSAIFVEIGFIVNNELVLDLVKTDKLGRIIVDDYQMTSVPGIFAAGDLSNSPFLQLTIAAGEGTAAALSANQYIEKHM